MNILPVNNNSQTNFNGKIITKGKWTNQLKETFVNNKEIQKLASGKHDIIGKISETKAHKYDINHIPEDNLYRLTLEATSSITDKIKSFLGINKSIKISQNYHSEDSLDKIIDKRINADTIAKKLNIEF